MPYLIGIDIGGTKCAVLLAVLENGIKIIDKLSFATEPDRGFEYTKDNLFRGIEQILLNNKLKISEVNAIGVSCGGPLDSRNGIILSPPNLPGWDEIHFIEMIREKFGIPAFLQNDANACALVEWKLGAGKGTSNMIFLTMGTGMGAGIITEGKLLVGASDMAGEVGHIRLEDSGPEGYGKEGSFEGFCSGGGIARLAKEKFRLWLKEGKSLSWCGSEEEISIIDAKLLAQSAKAGDIYAREIFKEVGEKLGKALALLMDVLNPERIIIGSIFVRCEEFIRPSMERVLEREALIYSRKACGVLAAGTGESIGDLASIMVAAHGLNLDLDIPEETEEEVLKHYEKLYKRYPELIGLKGNIMEAYKLLLSTYKNGGKILVCGNGGSAADSEHIVGELMKGFFKRRELSQDFIDKLKRTVGEKAEEMCSHLQGALPAIALSQHIALSTAFSNDVSADMVFAQQVLGYGTEKDLLLAISTSGNSKNVLNACIIGKTIGMKVIGLTGMGGGRLKGFSDVLISVPGECTAEVQEFHLPIYHTLCAMLEEKFF